VHLQLSILPGRSEEIRIATSNTLLAYLKKSFAHENCTFSVEVREMDKPSYSKTSTGTI
jgi:5-carboxymethyl-2-hydroxymuconate isomerase